jgi:hypothetical protein
MAIKRPKGRKTDEKSTFPPGPLLETAELAILCGSGLAGIFSLGAQDLEF